MSLSRPYDDIFDADMAYADIVGADAVSLFVSRKSPPSGVPDYRGIGWINTDLTKMDPSSYTTVVNHQDSIVHEIGHNMGVSVYHST